MKHAAIELDPISEFIASKGHALSTADLETIDDLLMDIPVGDAFERRGWAYESIFLIVNDPEYTGDIDLDKLDQE
jgi:hypothetical protein